jgi:hypothetical protein
VLGDIGVHALADDLRRDFERDVADVEAGSPRIDAEVDHRGRLARLRTAHEHGQFAATPPLVEQGFVDDGIARGDASRGELARALSRRSPVRLSIMTA